jgi:hydrogenase maturation protease
MENQKPKTLILGVGNILLSDEGIGVRVIEYLQTQPLPEDVELVDGGTAGADLIDVLADRETVIIVDAVELDQPPGTIFKLTPEDLLPLPDNPLSMHDLDIPQTLRMTELLGCAPKKVICFGVVPESIQPGMELTKELASLVPRIAKLVLAAASE